LFQFGCIRCAIIFRTIEGNHFELNLVEIHVQMNSESFTPKAIIEKIITDYYKSF